MGPLQKLPFYREGAKKSGRNLKRFINLLKNLRGLRFFAVRKTFLQ